MKFLFSKPVARYNCATLRHAISRQKNLYFPLPQESMRTTFHYPESPYGRTYADVITKISRIDSLPNYLSYGAPLERASRARSSAITRPVSFILITPQYRLSLFVTYHLHHHHHHSFVTVSFNYLLLLLCFSFAVFTVQPAPGRGSLHLIGTALFVKYGLCLED